MFGSDWLTVLQDAMLSNNDPDIQRKIAKLQRKMGTGETPLTKARRSGDGSARGRQKYSRTKADSVRYSCRTAFVRLSFVRLSHVSHLFLGHNRNKE